MKFLQSVRKIMNVCSTSNKIEDVVFWYKAKVGRKFRIGSPALWDHHKRNYNPKHDSTEPIESKVKQKSSVNVVKTDTTGKLKKKES